MIYRGVIFDFNGVLWWDNHLQEQAWRHFSAQVRGEPFSDEEVAVHVHGRTNRHTLEYLAGRALDASKVERLSEQKETVYRQLCLDQGPAFALSPGAAELLDYLVERGIPSTIATASGKANLDFFVEHLRLERWFDVASIVYDDGVRPGKPAPDIYLQAAANLGLAGGQCVVVEDSRSGIEAAHAAGIGCVVALGPVEDHDHLARLAGVDTVVSSLRHFPRERLRARRATGIQPVIARAGPQSGTGRPSADADCGPRGPRRALDVVAS
jgi:beta-phosphoglucomutase-like phosphatase (HAD superfamily)